LVGYFAGVTGEAAGHETVYNWEGASEQAKNYSKPHVKKNSWKELDHSARFLYQIR